MATASICCSIRSATGSPAISTWPDGLTQTATWYELPVSAHGVASVALLRAYTLPGGFQLLVGRDVRARAQLRNVLRDGLLWALGLMVALGILGAWSSARCSGA